MQRTLWKEGFIQKGTKFIELVIYNIHQIIGENGFFEDCKITEAFSKTN